jgi:hypothetical protein
MEGFRCQVSGVSISVARREGQLVEDEIKMVSFEKLENIK